MEMQAPSHQNSQVLPHIVQVYTSSDPSKVQNSQIIHISHPSLEASGNLSYQTITAQPLDIPEASHHIAVTQDHHNQQLRSLLACPEIPKHHQDLSISQEYNRQIPITHHVILKPSTIFNYKQVVVPTQLENFSEQFETVYQKEEHKCVQVNAAKLEPEVSIAVGNDTFDPYNSKTASKAEQPPEDLLETKKKRSRSPVPNPSKWACNVRKLKHQRGEAYISRRGKFVPEKKVKTTKDCLQSCKYKCSTVITDSDREHLFKSFYSLSSNEKKHFLLNTTERSEVKCAKRESNRRKYSFKYFFLVRAVRYAVCKNFYLGTLAISQKPVYNVHSGKNDWNIPKPDGRGQSEASAHSLPSEIKDRVRKHIMSFKTVDSKPLEKSRTKKQYIGGALNVKQMYKIYEDQCKKDNLEIAKESMYRKILKDEFNVHFKKVKVEHQLCSKCKGPVKNK